MSMICCGAKSLWSLAQNCRKYRKLGYSMNPYDVLIRPLLTEKITAIREIKNSVAFAVDSRATRIDVRRAVEKVFSVKVTSVNVMNVKGKKKRQGRYLGKRSDWRKAFVTLKEGEKIELYESA